MWPTFPSSANRKARWSRRSARPWSSSTSSSWSRGRRTPIRRAKCSTTSGPPCSLRWWGTACWRWGTVPPSAKPALQSSLTPNDKVRTRGWKLLHKTTKSRSLTTPNLPCPNCHLSTHTWLSLNFCKMKNVESSWDGCRKKIKASRLNVKFCSKEKNNNKKLWFFCWSLDILEEGLVDLRCILCTLKAMNDLHRDCHQQNMSAVSIVETRMSFLAL